MKETMWQQLMTEPGKITYREVPKPSCEPGKILLRIKRMGICGSDIHVNHGKHPFTTYPVTQGHEISGEIVEIGEGVTGYHVGQKAVLEPQVVCHTCHPCRNGKYNLCENLKVMGFQTTGAASEYFLAEASNVTVVPDSMTFDQAAMMEPLAVAVHAARRFSSLQNSAVVILGAGPIGILLGMVCKSLGARAVLMSDIVDSRLALARQCGIHFTVNSKTSSLEQAIAQHFGPDKADVIYDCAGNNTTMGQAIQYARKGSTICLVAVFAGMANVDLAVLNDKELTLDTTMMYRHEDFLCAIDLVTQGKVLLEPLMSKHFSCKEFESAYRYIDENQEKTMKVLVDFD